MFSFATPHVAPIPFIERRSTAEVALKSCRHFLGCHINPEYVKMAEEIIRMREGQ